MMFSKTVASSLSYTGAEWREAEKTLRTVWMQPCFSGSGGSRDKFLLTVLIPQVETKSVSRTQQNTHTDIEIETIF